MTRFIDLTGQKRGDWTIIDRDQNKKMVYWNCICKCGARRSIVSSSLLAGNSKSCKKCGTGKNQPKGYFTQPGEKTGKWTVIKRDIRPTYSVCQCECGAIHSVYRANLNNGTSKGCRKCMRGINHEAMIGRTFYKWTIIQVVRTKIKNKSRAYYECQCKCGFKKLLTRSVLINLRTSQCVACNKKQA